MVVHSVDFAGGDRMAVGRVDHEIVEALNRLGPGEGAQSPKLRMPISATVGARESRVRPTQCRRLRVVPQAGVEPATFRLGGGCSIR